MLRNNKKIKNAAIPQNNIYNKSVYLEKIGHEKNETISKKPQPDRERLSSGIRPVFVRLLSGYYRVIIQTPKMWQKSDENMTKTW